MTEFEECFLQERDNIFKYLFSIARDWTLAEELTQETFYRAYMNWSALRDKTSARAWLCKIGKNCYLTWSNEQKRRADLSDPDTLVDPNSPEEIILRDEGSQKALRCLHALEEPYREVMRLSVFGGVSLKEISRLFGKSESWARVTFYRARQKLSERMREDEV